MDKVRTEQQVLGHSCHSGEKLVGTELDRNSKVASTLYLRWKCLMTSGSHCYSMLLSTLNEAREKKVERCNCVGHVIAFVPHNTSVKRACLAMLHFSDENTEVQNDDIILFGGQGSEAICGSVSGFTGIIQRTLCAAGHLNVIWLLQLNARPTPYLLLYSFFNPGEVIFVKHSAEAP